MTVDCYSVLAHVSVSCDGFVLRRLALLCLLTRKQSLHLNNHSYLDMISLKSHASHCIFIHIECMVVPVYKSYYERAH